MSSEKKRTRTIVKPVLHSGQGLIFQRASNVILERVARKVVERNREALLMLKDR